MESAQFDSALFSVDKLFTEKELAMIYNSAATAAYKHILRNNKPLYYNEADSAFSNGRSDAGSENDRAIAGTGDADNDDADSPPGGATMERQYSHATRSTRVGQGNYNNGLGIETIGDLNYPGNFQAFSQNMPRMPPFAPSLVAKGYVKGEAANQPAGLSEADAAVIRQARAFNDKAGLGRNLDRERGGKDLLEAVSVPRRYDYWVQTDRNRKQGSTTTPTSNVREEAFGGEEMSKQSSAQGMSDVGGVAMSRQDTGGETSSRGRRLKPTGV
jgi:hypothetical protein